MPKKGDRGQAVTELQQLLVQRGYPVAVDGEFGAGTYRAVRAFQSQNLDQHGMPLVVDGAVGPLTWWSLRHPKPGFDPGQRGGLRPHASARGGRQWGWPRRPRGGDRGAQHRRG